MAASSSSSRRQPCRARHKALPVGDGEIDRRQGAAGQDRARDDDAGGRLLLDHQIGADAEHRRLQRHPQRAAGRAQSARHIVGAPLLREIVAAEIEPAREQPLRHPHRRDDLGVAPARFGEPVARGRMRGGGLDRAARQALRSGGSGPSGRARRPARSRRSRCGTRSRWRDRAEPTADRRARWGRCSTGTSGSCRDRGPAAGRRFPA